MKINLLRNKILSSHSCDFSKDDKSRMTQKILGISTKIFKNHAKHKIYYDPYLWDYFAAYLLSDAHIRVWTFNLLKRKQQNISKMKFDQTQKWYPLYGIKCKKLFSFKQIFNSLGKICYEDDRDSTLRKRLNWGKIS